MGGHRARRMLGSQKRRFPARVVLRKLGLGLEPLAVPLLPPEETASKL